MDDPRFGVIRVIPGGWAGGFDTAALVHGDIHDHTARLHGLDHGLTDKVRSLLPGDENRPDQQICTPHSLGDALAVAVQTGDIATERPHAGQFVAVAVKHSHLGPECRGHQSGITPCLPGPKHHNPATLRAGQATKQQALAAIRPV